MKSWLRTILYFLAIILVTASVTAGVTVSILRKERTDVVVLTAEEYAGVSDLFFLNEMIGRIKNDSFRDTPSREELLDAAAKGMVDSIGDQYAAYYNQAEYEEYLSNINGQYNGIGILVGQPDESGAAILDVYDDTPAAEAGILPGDVIAAVDGETIAGMQLEEVAKAIDRDVGETVRLTLHRNGEELTVEVVCAELNLKRVTSALFNQHTGYIRINMFTGNCAAEFKEALKDLTDRNMRSLVIDLRNNPGGSLTDVVSIADDILGEGVIVSVRGQMDAEGDVYRSNAKGIKVPLAIIVNENSASASEILAAAVQDFEAGIVVGMTTYGKGVVQTTRQLEGNRGWLKLTTDAYYTPNGANIDGVGVIPDIEIDLPEELKALPIDEVEQSDDAQLWAALDYVRALADEMN